MLKLKENIDRIYSNKSMIMKEKKDKDSSEMKKKGGNKKKF